MSKHYGPRYGYDRDGSKIQARDGERLLKEGEELPERYRPWLNGSGWLPPVKLHTHPGANRTACVFGNYWAFAVPDGSRVPTHVQAVESPPEPILVVPDVVPITAPEPVPDPTPSVPQKPRKRRSMTTYVNEIQFDD